MSTKTAVIHARTNPKLKADASVLFKRLGLDLSSAIDLFLRQAVAVQGLPFRVEIPNEETKRALATPLSEGEEMSWEELETLLLNGNLLPA